MKYNHAAIEQAKEIVMVLEQLNKEINKAGGGSWSIEHLNQTTALDFILTLAPNGVTLKYNRGI